MTKLSKEAELMVVEDYLSWTTLHEISSKYNIHYCTVHEIVRRNGYQLRGNFSYSINDNYFSNIDSADKAYWLGFIAADGAIVEGVSRYPTLTVTLNSIDYGHLEKFKEDLSYSGPIPKYRDGKICRLATSNHDIVNSLINLGIEPCKTFIYKPWKGPANLMPHYWRGYFDGDGSINFSRVRNKKGGYYNRKVAEASLIGTEETIDSFNRFINSFAEKSIMRKRKREKEKVFRTRTTKKSDIVIIGQALMYNQGYNQLERKGINVSLCDEAYQPVNPIMTFDI